MCRSYAYGLVLWCLFSGREIPFADDAGVVRLGVVSLARHVIDGGRPDVGALRRDTPIAIRNLIECCWAHDPAKRPTAFDIARELKKLLPEVR